MTDSVLEGSERQHRATPWAKKRRRLLIAFAIVVLLISPLLGWRLQLALEVRAVLTALRDAGRPVSMAELNRPRAALSAGKNAAVYYREAAALYSDIPVESWISLRFRGDQELDVGAPLSADAKAAMESLVTRNGPALKKLRAASALDDCHFIERFETELGISTPPHLVAVETLLTLICSDALLASERGETHVALDALGDGLALVRSLDSDGLMASLVTRWELEGRLLEVLRRLMGEAALSEGQLTPFMEYFRSERRVEAWRRMCDVEQCLFLSRIREGRNRGAARALLIAAGAGDLNMKAYLALMAPIREGFGKPVSKRRHLMEQVRGLERRIDAHPFIYTTLQLYRPTVWWSGIQRHWDDAVVSEIGIAVAVYYAKNGAYPEALAEITPDELNGLGELSDGSALHYARTEGGYRLWRTSEAGVAVDCWSVASGGAKSMSASEADLSSALAVPLESVE